MQGRLLRTQDLAAVGRLREELKGEGKAFAGELAQEELEVSLRAPSGERGGEAVTRKPRPLSQRPSRFMAARHTTLALGLSATKGGRRRREDRDSFFITA